MPIKTRPFCSAAPIDARRPAATRRRRRRRRRRTNNSALCSEAARLRGAPKDASALKSIVAFESARCADRRRRRRGGKIAPKSSATKRGAILASLSLAEAALISGTKNCLARRNWRAKERKMGGQAQRPNVRQLTSFEFDNNNFSSFSEEASSSTTLASPSSL